MMRDPKRDMEIGDAVAEIGIAIVIFVIVLFLSSVRAQASHDPLSVDYNRSRVAILAASPDWNRFARVRRNPVGLWWEIVPYRWIDPYPLYLRK